MSSKASLSGAEPQKLGRAFVKNYYQFMSQKPDEVFRFYMDDSIFTEEKCISADSKATPSVARAYSGAEGVTEAVRKLHFTKCVTKLLSLDVLPMGDANFHIMVVACRTGGKPASKNFAQSFFLVKKNESYYIQNSIFRWLPFGSSAKSAAAKKAPKKKAAAKPAPAPTPTPAPAPEPETETESKPELVAAPAPAPAKKKPVKFSMEGNQKKAKARKREDGPITWASIVPSSQKEAVTTTRFGTIVPRVETRKDPKPSPAKRRQKSNLPSGTSLYVKRIPDAVAATEVLDAFKRFGDVKAIDTFLDKGFAFVTFSKVAEAQRAFKAAISSGIQIRGRRVIVEEKKASTGKKKTGKGPVSKGGRPDTRAKGKSDGKGKGKKAGGEKKATGEAKKAGGEKKATTGGAKSKGNKAKKPSE